MCTRTNAPMYVCMDACLGTQTHTHACAWCVCTANVHMELCTHARTHARTHVHTRAHAHTHACTHTTHVRQHTHWNARAHASTHVRTLARSRTRTHAHRRRCGCPRGRETRAHHTVAQPWWYVRVYAHACVCVAVCVHGWMHVCVHVHVIGPSTRHHDCRCRNGR